MTPGTTTEELDGGSSMTISSLVHHPATLHSYAGTDWLSNVRNSRDPCFRLSQITWRMSVAHHPTEDIRC
jgi:hypothetical protein